MGEPAEVPEWASFFSLASYRAFVACVEAELASREVVFTMGDGVVRIATSGGGDDTRACGLANLAQMCHRASRDGWRDLVRHHFAVLFRAYGDGEGSAPATFDEARPLLKLRVYAAEYLAQVEPAELIHRPIAPGLVQVLTYDLPTHIASVAAEHARAWQRADDELFEVALANVRAEPPPSHETVPAFGETLEALVGESFFTASRVLHLADHVSPSATLGAVVCVPHRHAVVFHPLVEIERAIRAINALIPLGVQMFREGPGSISPSLYWWRREPARFVHLPTTLTGEAIQFAPPDEFIHEVLNRLAAQGRPN